MLIIDIFLLTNSNCVFLFNVFHLKNFHTNIFFFPIDCHQQQLNRGEIQNEKKILRENEKNAKSPIMNRSRITEHSNVSSKNKIKMLTDSDDSMTRLLDDAGTENSLTFFLFLFPCQYFNIVIVFSRCLRRTCH